MPRKISPRIIAVALGYGATFFGNHKTEKWDKKKFKIGQQTAQLYYYTTSTPMKDAHMYLPDYFKDLSPDLPYEEFERIAIEVVLKLKKRIDEEGLTHNYKIYIPYDYEIKLERGDIVPKSTKKKETKENTVDKKDVVNSEEVIETSVISSSEKTPEEKVVEEKPKTTVKKSIKSSKSTKSKALDNVEESPEILIRAVKKAREIGRRYKREKERKDIREEVSVSQPQEQPVETQQPKRLFNLKINPTLLITIAAVGVTTAFIYFFVLKKKPQNTQSQQPQQAQQPIQPMYPVQNTSPIPLAGYSQQDADLLRSVLTAERWGG